MGSAAVKFSGGELLKGRLAEIRHNLGAHATLSVGFFGDATEQNGMSTAAVAAINEFGGTIPARHVAAHQAEIFKSYSKKTGEFLSGGKFVRRAKANFVQTVSVPAHDIPAATIPPRPFFRRMISLGKPHWGEDLGKIMEAVNYDGKLALTKLGEDMAGELVQSIKDQVYAPLAKSTMAKKGFSTTLTDSSAMRNSVGSQVS